MKTLRRCTHALLFALLLPLTAEATTVLVNQTSPTTYTVSYADCLNVYGFKVSLFYDPQITSIQAVNPGAAAQAAKAIFTSNDFGTGKVNIVAAASNGFSPSGTLATITVGSVAGAVPRINTGTSSVSGKPNAIAVVTQPATQVVSTSPSVTSPSNIKKTDQDGQAAREQAAREQAAREQAAREQAAREQAAREQAAREQAATTQGTSSSSTVVTGGTVAIPGNPLADPPAPARPEERSVELETVPVAKGPESSEGSIAAAETKTPEKKTVQLTGILQRFKDYADEVTPAALMGLFVDPVEPLIKQDPVIVFADGTSNLKITIDSAYLTTSAPTLQLKGAKLLGLTTAENGAWVVKAVTREKITDVQLVIIDGERTVTVPVTVVPKIKLTKDKAGKIDAAEFSRVLADRGDKKPKYDFNADKLHDAVDDFIYTANYLKQAGLTPTKPKKPAQQAGKPAAEAKEVKPAAKGAAVTPKEEPVKTPEGKKKKP